MLPALPAQEELCSDCRAPLDHVGCNTWEEVNKSLGRNLLKSLAVRSGTVSYRTDTGLYFVFFVETPKKKHFFPTL